MEILFSSPNVSFKVQSDVITLPLSWLEMLLIGFVSTPYAINSSNHVLIGGCMVSKDMGYIFIFFFISTICFANVSPLYGVQILSPWITEMMKQRYEDIGPEGM